MTRICAVYRIRFQWIFPVELLLSAGRIEFWRRALAQQKMRQNGPVVRYMILLWYGRIPWILRPRPLELSASAVISFVHSMISKPIFRFVYKWYKQYPYIMYLYMYIIKCEIIIFILNIKHALFFCRSAFVFITVRVFHFFNGITNPMMSSSLDSFYYTVHYWMIHNLGIQFCFVIL